jgi:hypothetical protein
MAHLTIFVDESRAFFSASRLYAEVWMEIQVMTVDGPQRKRFVTQVQTIPSWTDEEAIATAFEAYQFNEWFNGDSPVSH